MGIVFGSMVTTLAVRTQGRRSWRNGHVSVAFDDTGSTFSRGSLLDESLWFAHSCWVPGWYYSRTTPCRVLHFRNTLNDRLCNRRTEECLLLVVEMYLLNVIDNNYIC